MMKYLLILFCVLLAVGVAFGLKKLFKDDDNEDIPEPRVKPIHEDPAAAKKQKPKEDDDEPL